MVVMQHQREEEAEGGSRARGAVQWRSEVAVGSTGQQSLTEKETNVERHSSARASDVTLGGMLCACPLPTAQLGMLGAAAMISSRVTGCTAARLNSTLLAPTN